MKVERANGERVKDVHGHGELAPDANVWEGGTSALSVAAAG